MGWTWGPSNWLWQATHTNGQFNPLAILNPTSANQWYAQHSAMNWQSGSFAGKAMAVTQDALGGYVTAWTGQSASAAQSWWSVPWSAATFFVGGGAGAALQTVSTWQGVSAGLCVSTNALTGGAPVSPLSAAFQVAGLGGNLLGKLARPMMQATVPVGNSQYLWNFSAISRGSHLSNIGQGLSAAGVVGSARNALAQSSPHVGGILFDHCEADLAAVGRITEAYWDAGSSCLVLVGPYRQSQQPVAYAMPDIDKDHLVVALRAYLSSQPMGVSIDPPAEYRDGILQGKVPPDGTPMFVSYLGQTEGTLFGAIMFEADRLLKCLDKGMDNDTRKPLRCTVPGFKSLVDRLSPSPDRSNNLWHRFWFVIDRVQLKYDPPSGAIAVGDVRLKVLTETEKDGKAQEHGLDPLDSAFAQHLTEHYDRYAEEFPVLARLKELAKTAALAKFLVNQAVSLDVRSIFATPPLAVDTPITTPAISVRSPNVVVEPTPGGRAIHSVSLFGGVDMDADAEVLGDTEGLARRQKGAAESARPATDAERWSFGGDTSRQCAVALPLGSVRPYRATSEDHAFTASGNQVLCLRRSYDSSWSLGEFGPGWSLHIPFSLGILRRGGKRAEVLTQRERQDPSSPPVLLLQDRSAGTAALYRQTNQGDSPVFCRVTSQRVVKGGAEFQYDPGDRIRQKGNGFLLERAAQEHHFDCEGRLVEIRKVGRFALRFDWAAGQMTRMSDPSGRSYAITYGEEKPPRISLIVASDGSWLKYEYDSAGRLAACETAQGIKARYAYDNRGRLAEIRDGRNRVVRRNVYDMWGNLASSGSDTVWMPQGGKVSRFLDNNGRLVAAEDGKGCRAAYEYGAQEELKSIAIRGQGGHDWKLEFDSAGQLTGFSGPAGPSLQFAHEPSGRIVRVGVGRESATLAWDAEGKLLSVTEGSGKATTAAYDSSNRPTEIVSSTGQTWRFRYKQDLLVETYGPEGSCHVLPGRQTLTLATSRSDGAWDIRVLDRGLQVLRYQSQGARPVQFLRDPTGNLSGIRNECGEVRYGVDESALTADIVFGNK